jgi:hypothetical protein
MHPTRPVRSAPWAGLVLLLAVLGTLLTGPPAQATSQATTRVTARVATNVAAKVAPVVVRGCSSFGGAKALGYYYADAQVRIYACGARPAWDGARTDSGPVVLPYAGSRIYYRGYQCIELVARYLKARFNADAGVANGAQAVDRYVAAYPAKFVKIANGSKRLAPRKGDVLSLSRSRTFNDVGHTGIVISSSVSSAGNGSVLAVEQNWGGAGGSQGYHRYRVTSWRVQSPGMAYVKWLRAR